MGCVKSKKSQSAARNANSTEKGEGGAKRWRRGGAYLVRSETGSPASGPRVDPALLDYAQRLSEEIVGRAVQQWVEVDRRYCDIPYIECDLP
ncbi:small membrane A-kinase anchor protein [Brachionichthys hirsutus]|uniref:small membrane A-kinase anchor protein n=1 Tax=Brachionichthys hirsutus TaxID=412623 RepID=UPI0036052C43